MSTRNDSQRLRELRLIGMELELLYQYNTPELQALAFDERLGRLLDAEELFRNNRRLQWLLKAAKLKVQASVDEIDFNTERGLNREQIACLVSGDWIARGQNVAITGPTGTGKTWLASALGLRACRLGLSVRHARLPQLLADMEIAARDGSLPKLRNKLAKVQLLILDDLALTPITVAGREHLATIVDDRAGERSLLITSQLPIAKWFEWIGEPTIADAILDRVVHNVHRVELRGESQRKLRANQPKE